MRQHRIKISHKHHPVSIDHSATPTDLEDNETSRLILGDELSSEVKILDAGDATFFDGKLDGRA